MQQRQAPEAKVERPVSNDVAPPVQETRQPGPELSLRGPLANSLIARRDPAANRRMLTALQRSAGNAAVSQMLKRPVQRQGVVPPRSAVQRAMIDGENVVTYADLDRWYTTRIGRLQAQQSDLGAGEVLVPASIGRAISSARERQSPLRDDPAGQLDGIRAVAAQAWFDSDYRRANNDAEAARGRIVAQRMERARSALAAADRQLNGSLMDDLRDAQRSAYHATDESTLAKVADTIATVLDTSLVLRDGVVGLARTRSELVSAVNYALMYQGNAPPLNTNAWVTKIANGLQLVDNALAAIALVRASINLLSGGTSEAAEGRQAVAAMGTVISAGGTLLGASAPFTVYVNLYLGPMIEACLGQLARLEDVVRRGNREAMDRGDWDSVVWSVEAGGRHVFDFMSSVMRASGPEGIPSPIPARVSSYMVDNRDRLASGAGSSELPTTGWWFWRKLDTAQAPQWIFRMRAELWGMFYGSAPVPR